MMKQVKLVRRCPRCRKYAYQQGNFHGIFNRIACVNCGHEWQGRITAQELLGVSQLKNTT